MKNLRFVALAVCLALTAFACDNTGLDVATDSAPVRTPATVVERTTTTNPDIDRSIAVRHRVLIGHSNIGTSYRTAVLTNDEVWELDGMVELDDGGFAVNLSFTLDEDRGCDSRELAGLRFDPDSRLLYPDMVSDGRGECRADVHTVVVSVVRSELPREFVMSTEPPGSTQGLSGQTEIGIGQLGIADDDPLVLRSTNDLAVGDVRYVAFNTHCGVEQIGYLINGSYWQLTGGPGGGDYIPSEWRQFVDGETLMLEVALTSPDVLFVSPSGQRRALAYAPITEADLAGCM